jgi:tetraacyldisaccharide 4'-kinase
MNWLTNILLFLPSKLYGLGIYLRNQCYAIGVLPSQTVGVPTVVVGNLEAGGAGKTTHTELLIELLRNDLKHIAVLSRGYKRQTTGFVLADAHATPATIGDEPYQIHQKYAPQVQVAVCANRLHGIQNLVQHQPSTQLVLLDDGFQHRALQAGFYILLTDFSKPFYDDNLLPMGRLREHKRAAKRADLIIFTKSPQDLNVYEKKRLSDLAKSVPRQKILFSYLEYDDLRDFDGELLQQNAQQPQHILLTTGIAKPAILLNHLQKTYKDTVKHLQFPDHHNYKTKDLEKIKIAYNKIVATEKLLICTEKDWVKLRKFSNFFNNNSIKCGYLPVKAALNATDTQILRTSVLDYTKQALLMQKSSKT